jgi:hypothetical protein
MNMGPRAIAIAVKREERSTELGCVNAVQATPLSPALNCAHVLSWKWGRQVRGGSRVSIRHAIQPILLGMPITSTTACGRSLFGVAGRALLCSSATSMRYDHPNHAWPTGKYMTAQAPSSDTQRRESRRAAIGQSYTRRYALGQEPNTATSAGYMAWAEIAFGCLVARSCESVSVGSQSKRVES